jgi:uncharacterized protein
MTHTERHVLLRVFLEESYKYKGKPAYQVLLEYLRTHDYAGATALRGIEGFGRKHKMHSADMLELSTDLPIVVEIIDTPEKIESLKSELEETEMVNGALVTEEQVSVTRFSK